MEISNNYSTAKVWNTSNKNVSKSSKKNKWKLTDSLKEKIVDLAKKDAQDNVYMGKYQGTGTGSAIHVYNEDGEEVLTYTGGVGWQEKETKAESQVHSALKMTYYEAFSEARKALNSEEKTGSVGENIILQDNFDMKA